MRNLVLYSMLQTGLSRKRRIFFAFQTYTYDKLTHDKHPFNCTIIFRIVSNRITFPHLFNSVNERIHRNPRYEGSSRIDG